MRTIGVAGVSAAGAPIVLVAGAVDATTVGVGMWLGWSLGYLAYDQLHWRAHHRIPTTRYTSRLRQRHELHHYGHPQRNFGVTSGFWDRVFGTGQPLTDA